MNHLRISSLGKTSAKHSPTRRQLLKALGVTAAVAPLVPSLDGWAAGAAAPNKKLLLVFTPDGIVPEQYWPTGTETAFTFPTGGILEPLNPYKADLIVFKNMARATGGSGGAHEHAMGGLWTGNSIASNQNMAASVDQIIAQKLPKATDFQSLQFGVQSFYDSGNANAKTASVNSYMIYSGPKAQIPAESDPYKMFDRIFGTFTAPGAGAAPAAPSPDMMKIRAEKQSIIDYLTSDITNVRAKLGKTDGAKLDAHLDTVRDIERRLQGTGLSDGAVLAACAPGTKPMMLDLNSNANFPDLIKITNKMVVAAFACDRTRIASLQYSRGFSNCVHTWVGAKDTHHTLSHGTQNAPVLGKIQNFYQIQIADLVSQLKAVQDGGVPMLDNMLMVYANELYLGWTHGVSPSPCYFMGKAGGAIKTTGRVVDFGMKNDHNQMLQTVATAMGVPGLKVGDLGTAGVLPGILA